MCGCVEDVGKSIVVFLRGALMTKEKLFKEEENTKSEGSNPSLREYQYPWVPRTGLTREHLECHLILKKVAVENGTGVSPGTE